jgi:dienelactone hydrolase
MKILKRVFQGIGIIIGIIAIYLLTVALLPGIKVPAQPFEKGQKIVDDSVSKPTPGRKDVSFKVKGTSLSAWLYLPESPPAAVPCIVMAHGFGGTKDMLESYAVHYQEAGFAVLVFDYRHFGESEGKPRQLVWIPYQLEDWSAAIKYARSLKEIDSAKVALWGTSFSGGHVIVMASKDEKIACVSAQCPGLDGHASGEMFVEREGVGKAFLMLMHGQRDMVRSWLGLSPHKIPIAGKPGSIAFLTTPDAYDGYKKLVPEGFVNEACARLFLRAGGYRPVEHAHKVRCPVLLQICDKDTLLPKSAAEETEKELGNFAEIKHYPIGHFDIYTGDNFKKSVEDQLSFFKKHL